MADKLPGKCLKACLKTFASKQENLDESAQYEANPQGVADEPPKKGVEACLKIFSSEQNPQLYFDQST